ncbi:MAG: helix-turn-helix transcriptional regulator [Bauldia sp.]
MNRPVRTKTPAGEDIVMMPVADYERLLDLAEDARDSRIAEKALAEAAAGNVDLLTHVEVKALLAAPSPMAFWRKRRGLTQAALAKIAGITQAYLAQIEGAKRVGDVNLYRRLAVALRVDVEDLLLPAAPEKGRARRRK